MERRAQSEGFGWIDPAGLSLESLPDWADERWAEMLEDLLVEFGPFRTDDLLRAAALEAQLNDLSFVRRAKIDEVLWPGGLELELELRRPIACIPVGRHFLPVSDEGVVLPGFWTRPPLIAGQVLPVIAPLEDAFGIFQGAEAGDWLAEERHIDALAIVRSLRQHLSSEEIGRLGRFCVLALDARLASPDVPGAMLLLEGGRRIWIGRPPEDEVLGVEAAPGELPAWAKWEAVSRALALLEKPALEGGTSSPSPSGAWQVVDVRWDRPEILLEPAQLEDLAEETRLASLPETPPRRVYQPSSVDERIGDRRPGEHSGTSSARPGAIGARRTQRVR